MAAARSRDPFDLELGEQRQRFGGAFAAQYEAIRVLVDQIGTVGPGGPTTELGYAASRLAEQAATVGYPTIFARASELESIADRAALGSFDLLRARVVVDALQEAYIKDMGNPAAVRRQSEPAPKPAPAARQAPQPVPEEPAKILIADDEQDQREMLTTCLTHAGYRTVGVASGDQVLSAVRYERPALILLDIAMPKLDGYSVCKLLKSHPDVAGIPVVFMTAGATINDKLAGLTLGADEFLMKPFDLRELVLRIKLLLKRSVPIPPAPIRAV
jgi:CheY-like chemotaxis protein